MSASKKIVITGVSRGLGLAMAKGFSERGHRIAGCARSESTLEEIRNSFGDPHRFDTVDVSNDGAVASWAADLLANFGTPDLLINGAALINRNAPLWEIPDEEFSRLMEVNICGVANVIRHFMPALIEVGSGVIVNFSSGWGRSTSPEVAPYCASKWAIEGLNQAFARELPPGLATVAFNPGIIDTDMLRSCFGEGASHHPDPETWAGTAVPFLENLGPSDNGAALTCPGH